MRIILISLILVSGIFTSVAVFALSQDMEFTVSCDKPGAYKTQDPIKIGFKLKNKSNSPIYVNKRFYLGQEEDTVKDRDLYLSVISPSGQKLSYKFPYKTGLPKSDYFVLLKPGEEVSSEYPRNINGTFEFNEPGEYKITAVYQNAYGIEIGVDAFKDKIESNSITISVIK
jgi:hypothetical protein